MVLEVIGKFRHEPRSKSSRIQIPAKMVWDSAFPLREGEIIVRIAGIISPSKTMRVPRMVVGDRECH